MEYKKFRVRSPIRSFRDLEIYKKTTELSARIHCFEIPANLKNKALIKDELKILCQISKLVPKLIAEAYGDSTTNYGGFIIGQNTNGTLRTFIDTTGTGGWDGLSSVGTVNDGNWHHVVLVYDGTNRYIYIDGVKDASTDVPAGYDSTPTNPIITIGQGSYNMEEHEGKIDQVRIYGYARTPAQIAWDYNRGGPIGWWRMDENSGSTVHDETDNGYDGTMMSMDPANDWVDGKFNRALDFDGSDDYVSVSTSKTMDGTNESMFFWMKYVGGAYVLSGGKNGWGRRLINTAFTITDANSVYYSCSVPGIQDGNWHHVGYTFTDGIIKSYVDGILTDTDNTTDGANLSSSALTPNFGRVCAGTSCPAGFFQGLLDDIRVYNYALTAQQVKDLYNYGAVRFEGE